MDSVIGPKDLPRLLLISIESRSRNRKMPLATNVVHPESSTRAAIYTPDVVLTDDIRTSTEISTSDLKKSRVVISSVLTG